MRVSPAGGLRAESPLHHAPHGPPPRSGEDFRSAAARLAGLAGAVLGWGADAFWRATPAELAGVVAALGGQAAVGPPGHDELAALMEAFPDG